MSTPTRYPSDLTDAEWERIAFLFPERPQGVVGRPREHPFRAIVNAILYRLGAGCPWRYLPKDFPAYTTVSTYYHRWRRNGKLTRLLEVVRGQVRSEEGREPTPSAMIMDSQSVKTTEKGGLKSLSKRSAMTPTRRSKDANAISSSTRSVCPGLSW